MQSNPLRWRVIDINFFAPTENLSFIFIEVDAREESIITGCTTFAWPNRDFILNKSISFCHQRLLDMLNEFLFYFSATAINFIFRTTKRQISMEKNTYIYVHE